MGLRDFWDRLTGGDEVKRVEEELEEDRVEDPGRVEDYEGMKDDNALRGHLGGTDFDADRDL